MNALAELTLSPFVVIPMAAAASIFCIVLVISLATAGRQERVARIRGAASRSGQTSGGAKRSSAGSGDDLMMLIRGLVQRFNLMRDRRGEALTAKLARAGWRSKDAVTLYLFAKLTFPFAAAGLSGGWLFLVNNYGLDLAVRLGAVVLASLVASHLPELVVKNQTARRTGAIRKALPDALDLMVICAEAGLSLDASLNRVAREMAPTSRELADEFGLTLLELRFMPDRRRALENLAKRVDLPAVNALVNTLFQTEKFGTPLAQALRVLASELRTERMLRAEEKAARLPAIMTVPLIVFIMPALFIVLMGAAILDIGDVFSKI